MSVAHTTHGAAQMGDRAGTLGPRQRRNIAVIADDLTGASDSGVQFARRGLETLVLFSYRNLVDDTAQVDVAALDTDSRALPAADAYERVRAAASAVARAGFAHVYKKVDSTLRGNLGAEIDAVMDAFAGARPFDLAVVAPAFPRIGRTTADGIHLLKGVPIAETEIARDPRAPVHRSDVVGVLTSQSKRKAALIGLYVLRQGPEEMLRQVGEARAGGFELIVFDATADEDLRLIARTLAQSQLRLLWVGSAGLAEYLPEELGLLTPMGEGPISPAAGAKGAPSGSTTAPVLLVAGSVSKVTREQLAAVERLPGQHTVVLDPLPLLAGGEAANREISRCVADLTAAVGAGHDCTLRSASSPQQVAAAQEQGSRAGLASGEVAGRIARTLGKVTGAVLGKHPLGGMILAGGDTAKAVCEELGVTGFRLLREVEPGVPMGWLVGTGHDLPAVTKAGAFGSEHTLSHAITELHEVGLVKEASR